MLFNFYQFYSFILISLRGKSNVTMILHLSCSLYNTITYLHQWISIVSNSWILERNKCYQTLKQLSPLKYRAYKCESAFFDGLNTTSERPILITFDKNRIKQVSEKMFTYYLRFIGQAIMFQNTYNKFLFHMYICSNYNMIGANTVRVAHVWCVQGFGQ